MELQPVRAARESRNHRKMSHHSQMKTSNMAQQRASRMLESSRFNYSNQFQTVFNPKANMLQPVYCDTIAKIGQNPIMHIGICLSFQNMLNILKLLFNDSINKAFPSLNKFNYNKEQLGNIYFLPFWTYKIDNCSIVLWLLPSENLKQLQKRRIYDIFLSYPQIIIIDQSTYDYFASKRLNLTKILKFQQQIILLNDKQNTMFQSQRRKQLQNHKFHCITNLNQNAFNHILFLTMKKNSTRCFQESLRINFFILQALSYGNQSLIDQKYDLTKQNNLTSILHLAASNYLTQQIEKKYDSYTQSFKNSPPKNEKQIQIELNQCQDNILKEVKQNFRILNSKQRQKQLSEACQKIISANNQQILANNRQMTKRQNNQVMNQLYQKLLSNFDKGRYNTKDREKLMAQDLQSLMLEYQKRAVKSSSLFFIFNTFMRHNKSRYYQKIQTLEDQNDYTRKTQNFDEIFDKIQIKKKVLYTLQKQVRLLENKKNQIQLQNQHLKTLEKQLNQKNFQSDNQQLAEVDSIKSIKTKQVSVKSPRGLNNSNILVRKKQKNKQNLMRKKQNKKCFQCCNCAIF